MSGKRNREMPKILGIPWKPEKADRDLIRSLFKRLVYERQKNLIS